MRTVWAYPLVSYGSSYLTLPLGSEVLGVGYGVGGVELYVEVETGVPQIVRRTFFVATGYSEVPAVRHRYIGTAHQLSVTPQVQQIYNTTNTFTINAPQTMVAWHVFELLETPSP